MLKFEKNTNKTVKLLLKEMVTSDSRFRNETKKSKNIYKMNDMRYLNNNNSYTIDMSKT